MYFNSKSRQTDSNNKIENELSAFAVPVYNHILDEDIWIQNKITIMIIMKIWESITQYTDIDWDI